jgi:RNA polymerase sigma factor (sigma-70 family)
VWFVAIAEGESNPPDSREHGDVLFQEPRVGLLGAVTPADASSAVEQVVGRFAILVKRVAWRHRLHDADVDELFQDLRIRLWHAAERGEQIETLPASYVYQAAVSAALDTIRRRRSQRCELSVPLEDHLENAAMASHSGEATTEMELAQQVTTAISKIHESRRPVVRMYLAGYPREEIAELLGWSEAKTRNLLYRGMADLRTKLSEAGIEP